MGVPSEVRGQLAARFEVALLGSVTPPNDPRNQPNHRVNFLRLPGRFALTPQMRTRLRIRDKI
jgi:hypothetical protein